MRGHSDEKKKDVRAALLEDVSAGEAIEDVRKSTNRDQSNVNTKQQKLISLTL